MNEKMKKNIMEKDNYNILQTLHMMKYLHKIAT